MIFPKRHVKQLCQSNCLELELTSSTNLQQLLNCLPLMLKTEEETLELSAHAADVVKTYKGANTFSLNNLCPFV
jgi:hypothetical protein